MKHVRRPALWAPKLEKRTQGIDSTIGALLGCESFEAHADTLATGRVGPLRADGPAACGSP